MPESNPISPPARLRELAQWQFSKIATLGARVTARRMPSGGRADFAVLAALEQYGPLSQAELGRRLGLDRNDVNVVVNRLQQGSHLDREMDPTDRRRNTITITTAGGAYFRDLQNQAAAVQDELLESLDENERRQLKILLTKILANQAPQSA